MRIGDCPDVAFGACLLGGRYVILSRMNGFRVTVLTLLCLAVGLMFYAILFVVPSWQEQYNAYQSTLRISEYEKKSDIHRQQMMAYDTSNESPEVEQARLAQEAAAERDEKALNEAEESNVVAAAKRREEAARAQAEAEAAQKAAQPTIGTVASFDKDWDCIMIKPTVPEAFLQGAVLAVRRDKMVVCEAVVDSRDEQSGQVSATVKRADFGQASVKDGERQQDPMVGDEVIVSPFLSADELQNQGKSDEFSQPAPVSEALPTPAVQQTPPVGTPPPVTELPADVKEALDALKESKDEPKSAAPANPEKPSDPVPLPSLDGENSSTLPSL